MIDNSPNNPQPRRPPMRGGDRYAVLTEAAKATVPSTRKELFSLNMTATLNTGESMDNKTESQILLDLVFQPLKNGLRLRPAEIQLLLSHINEILKELEIEEQLAAQQPEHMPCT
jgi:hypothetical protein